MREGDTSSTFAAAIRASLSCRRSAALALRAAEFASRYAQQQEQFAGTAGSRADTHLRLAKAHRRTERLQRTAARVHLRHARRLEAWVVGARGSQALPPVLMDSVASLAGWQGAVLAISTLTGDESLVAATDSTSRRAHELELSLVEGPSCDALRGSESTVIGGTAIRQRWPRYGPAVEELGVRSVSAVPVYLGTDRPIGSLTVWGRLPSRRADSRSDLAELAATLTETMLCAQESAQPDKPCPMGLGVFEDQDFQPELHQAAGVMHERCALPIADAIALIRAHAFAEDRSVAEVADEVLHGQLVLP